MQIDWTDEEVKILKKYYHSSYTLKEIQGMLTNDRTVSAIKAKALKLKLKRPSDEWTEEEYDRVREHYPHASKEELLKLFPGRNYIAIVAKASIMGVKRETFWTTEEDKILKKYYRSRMSYEEILNLLPGRNYCAILHRASRLGLKKGDYVPISKEASVRRWTKDEVATIKKYYGTMSDNELLKLLPGRTMSSVMHFANKFKLSKRKRSGENPFKLFPSWSAEEDRILLENYNQLPTDELVKLFPGRTWGGVKSRMYILKLKRDKYVWARRERFKPWKPDEDEVLIQNAGKTIAEINELLPHRTPLGIERHAKKLGVNLGKSK